MSAIIVIQYKYYAENSVVMWPLAKACGYNCTTFINQIKLIYHIYFVQLANAIATSSV